MEARSLVAEEAAMVFDFDAEVTVAERDEDAEGVRRVPEGDSLLSIGGFGSRRRSQPCRRACEGVIRVAGSQSRHR